MYMWIKSKYLLGGDSKATLLTSALFAYVPDDFKVFSTECAELFTECNYKGKPVLLCDNINNLRDLAEQPVKSVHVPRGKAVKLYNRKDL